MTSDERAMLKAVIEMSMILGQEYLTRLEPNSSPPISWNCRDLRNSMAAIRDTAARMSEYS